MQLFHLCWHDPKKTTLSCTLWVQNVLVVVHPYSLRLDNKHKSACFRSVMILMLTLIRGYELNIICCISLLSLGNIPKCDTVLTVWWNRKAAFSLQSEIENIIWYSTGCQWKISSSGFKSRKTSWGIDNILHMSNNIVNFFVSSFAVHFF